MLVCCTEVHVTDFKIVLYYSYLHGRDGMRGQTVNTLLYRQTLGHTLISVHITVTHTTLTHTHTHTHPHPHPHIPTYLTGAPGGASVIMSLWLLLIVFYGTSMKTFCTVCIINS